MGSATNCSKVMILLLLFVVTHMWGPCFVMWFLLSQVKINKNYQRKIVNIFLPISLTIFFGSSKEPSHEDGSF